MTDERVEREADGNEEPRAVDASPAPSQDHEDPDSGTPGRQDTAESAKGTDV
jgi:hypothetical protein